MLQICIDVSWFLILTATVLKAKVNPCVHTCILIRLIVHAIILVMHVHVSMIAVDVEDEMFCSICI